MRTLIVDNHDSFTFNLAHLVASITGRWPEVVANDDENFDPADLVRFDRVLISPGPGHPGRREDFGHSAVVLRTARRDRIPVLGVCLGHQGIAHLAGGRVAVAPTPRHGCSSPVRHAGTGLFDGIPSPVRVVRYHSLAVTDLPPEFEPTAVADDGVLMAFRHRQAPIWGVQFHPESVCTEHGRRLLANFLLGAGAEPRAAPSAAEPVLPVQRRRPTHRVVVRELAEAPDAETAFDALFADADSAFWLDSSTADFGRDVEGTRDRRGRYAIMGDARGPRAATATADVVDGTVTVRDAAGTRVIRDDFFTWLEDDLTARCVVLPELPFPFALGWVGYAGYELKAVCGGRPVHRSDDPDAGLVFADRALVVDHWDERSWLLALVELDDPDEGHIWFDEVEAVLSRLPRVGSAPPGAPPRPAVLEQRHDRAAYTALIDECRRLIAAGETYEVCLTTMLKSRVPLDPWASYRRLRRLSPAPYGAFLRLGGLGVLSTSPERFLRVGADRTVESKPIKGTRPRSADPDEDSALREELGDDEKDRAENLMVVDMVRHDLGATALTGSVEVDPLFAVETHARAHQLVSTVRSRLAPGYSAVDCVRAAFPGGSMTGAPKKRTMEIIDRLEGGPRGIYSGALGYFSLSGDVDLGMVIRTLVTRPDGVSFGVGGAIIALSDPAAEYEEIIVKATALTTLLGCDFPGGSTPSDQVA